MTSERKPASIIGKGDFILVTGATGFIGSKVVENLLERDFARIRCFTRRSDQGPGKGRLVSERVEMFAGNLLSPDDCLAATEGVSVVLHLAAGRGEKSFPDAFMNSVVTTRNLLDACVKHGRLRRFVNVSSFAVYSNVGKPKADVLDEECPVEEHPERRGEAYCFAKVKQEEIVAEYGANHSIPYVIVRPGHVYGPGNEAISGRVGVGTFGVFLHLGGSNSIPLTYVDNCADLIVLAALTPGVDGEAFNAVDDCPLSSRRFLSLYKRNVRRFTSIFVPHFASYALCYLWEKYSNWSEGQLPPTFNRNRWHAFWKKTQYTNQKAKSRLGWSPKIPTEQALQQYFSACRAMEKHA